MINCTFTESGFCQRVPFYDDDKEGKCGVPTELPGGDLYIGCSLAYVGLLNAVAGISGGSNITADNETSLVARNLEQVVLAYVQSGQLAISL